MTQQRTFGKLVYEFEVMTQHSMKNFWKLVYILEDPM
jgi:hypothetical protein